MYIIFSLLLTLYINIFLNRTIEYNVYRNPCSTLCHYHYLANIGKNTFKGLNNLKKM